MFSLGLFAPRSAGLDLHSVSLLQASPHRSAPRHSPFPTAAAYHRRGCASRSVTRASQPTFTATRGSSRCSPQTLRLPCRQRWASAGARRKRTRRNARNCTPKCGGRLRTTTCPRSTERRRACSGRSQLPHLHVRTSLSLSLLSPASVRPYAHPSGAAAAHISSPTPRARSVYVAARSLLRSVRRHCCDRGRSRRRGVHPNPNPKESPRPLTELRIVEGSTSVKAWRVCDAARGLLSLSIN